MSLNEDDRVKVTGYVAVPGMDEGQKYRIIGVDNLDIRFKRESDGQEFQVDKALIESYTEQDNPIEAV